MANFESGVASYIMGVAIVKVPFPVDFRGNAEIACKHCPYLERGHQRCGLNKEVVNYPERYVGDKCPLERMDDNA